MISPLRTCQPEYDSIANRSRIGIARLAAFAVGALPSIAFGAEKPALSPGRSNAPRNGFAHLCDGRFPPASSCCGDRAGYSKAACHHRRARQLRSSSCFHLPRQRQLRHLGFRRPDQPGLAVWPGRPRLRSGLDIWRRRGPGSQSFHGAYSRRHRGARDDRG
jgi:hypothetical protein